MTDMQKFPTHYEMMRRIPLKDGISLSARIWLPLSSVQDGKVISASPAILEYLPYHATDGTRARDDVTYPHFAARGYVGVRVDIRGTGDSEGAFEDEYSETELQDGCDVIAWIAEQDWCDGNVGMIGISWGGFNGLQIAYLRPPALKAVITACSTHDRYNGDIHYKGGCHLTDNFTWSQQMLSLLSRAPYPDFYGGNWREAWKRRLNDMPNLAEIWMTRQRRDDFWKHGSVCEDYRRINIPVLAVGGWQDAYTKTVFRLGKNLKSCQAIIGPWEHAYPNIAVIEPRLDFLNMACDFWDKHLRERQDIKADLQSYIMTYQPPSSNYGACAGYWVETPASYKSDILRFYLNDEGLGEAVSKEGRQIIDSPCHVGAARRNFCPGMRLDGELSDDQQKDDALSLCFDSAILKEDLTLLGETQVTLRIASDQPQANVIARLTDVVEDGQSRLIAWGCLNLSHREGSEKPHPMPIGEMQNIVFALTPCGYRIPAGHCLRLALSNHYWPMLWPSPQVTKLDLKTALSYVDLPILSAHKIIEIAPTPQSPVSYKRLSATDHWQKNSQKHDLFISEAFDDFGEIEYPEIGVRTSNRVLETAFIGTSPLSAKLSVEWQRTLSHPAYDWDIRTITGGDMHADENYFYVSRHWKAFNGDKEIFSKSDESKIARDNQSYLDIKHIYSNETEN